MEWLSSPEIWVAFLTLTALEIVLRSTLDQVQSARKSAQDRPSNLDSLPVADVFAATGDNSSFNIPSL